MSDYNLIRFHANWCSPCKMMAKTIDSLINEFPNITLQQIDIDEDVEKSREYKVRSIPTLILLQDGQEVARLIGNHSADQVRKFLTR